MRKSEVAYLLIYSGDTYLHNTHHFLSLSSLSLSLSVQENSVLHNHKSIPNCGITLLKRNFPPYSLPPDL
jgi:hypothetical protein